MIQRYAIALLLMICNVAYSDPTLDDELRAPRLDAPDATSPISVVVPAGCDCEQITNLLRLIKKKIGTVDQSPCADTILGILGDACTILGPDISISSALDMLFECCAGTFTVLDHLQVTATVDLSTVFTALTDIKDTLTDCCAQTQQNFNETWTILAALDLTATADLSEIFTVLADIKDTLTACCAETDQDFNETWTILADIKDTLTDCCAEMQQNFNETWTILAALDLTATADLSEIFTVLADIKDTLTACCAETDQDFNETWTILADIKDTLTACCAETDQDFNETWTILASLSADNCNPVYIYQKDFAPSGQDPYVINTSGVYKLAEDITYNPTVALAAITISASDVILDLQCFKLQQGTLNTAVEGISVSTNSENVTIMGGMVENFGLDGIYVAGPCSNLKIKDMVIADIGQSCITLDGAPSGNQTITHLLIDNVEMITSCTNPSGGLGRVLIMEGCSDATMRNCNIERNTTTAATLYGMSINNCLKCLFDTIKINDNTANTTLRSIYIQDTTSYCIFKNIFVLNNSSTAGSSSAAYGVSFLAAGNSDYNEFYDCIVSGLRGNAEVYGFDIQSTSDYNLFDHCEAANNTSLGVSTSSLVRGFEFNTVGAATVIDCIARNNTAPTSGLSGTSFPSVGFYLNTASNVTVLRCLASGNTGTDAGGAGFRVANGSNNTIQDCQAYRNDYGFRLEPINSTDHLFTRNVSSKNTNNYSQFPGGAIQIAVNIGAINGSLTRPWTNIGVG